MRLRVLAFALLSLFALAACGAPAETAAPATQTAPAEPPSAEPTTALAAQPAPTSTPIPASPTATPSPTPTASPTATPTATPTPGPATYRLRPGDTLGAVALNAGVSLDALLAVNNLTREDANIIKKGTVLLLPEGAIPPEQWPVPTPVPLPTFVANVPPAEAPIIYLGPERKQVALTFDTGYNPDINRQIAQMLAERGVRATFFVVGSGVEQYPDVVRDIVANGHELANHSWSHKDMTKMSAEQVRAELLDTEAIVQSIVPTATTRPFFRAPFGYVNETVQRVAGEEGFYIVDWTIDSLDWLEGIRPDEVRWTVARGLRPGAIIVQHGSSEASLAALPEILDLLAQEGYEAVTLSELLQP